jgi:phage tail sheath protein FI
LTRGRLPLQAGRDGLAALTPLDFTGDDLSLERWGLRRLEEVDEVGIVGIPDILIIPTPPVRKNPLPPPETDPCLPGSAPEQAAPPPPPLVERPPAFSLDDLALVQERLVSHCETSQDRLALLDPPPLEEQDIASTLDQVQSWRQRFDSSYAALYFPWLQVLDPLESSLQQIREIPPCGHVAGIFARTDRTTGVHKAPANEELEWVQGTVIAVTPSQQGILNPEGINVIRPFPGRGVRLYGARTLSRDTVWRFVNVRRLLLMIEETLEKSLQWAVFEGNDYRLRQTITLAVSSFLRELWQRGALVGRTPDEAYGVKCDEQNNPPDGVELGQLIVDVAVAPVHPAEFVIFRIGRTEGELRVAEAAGILK